ncbi:23S rRNA (adenine(2503)-C(2))-methyltransferase RlmN [Coraliomargarita algicola]|uniref:Probable dual-specificity RNA methyltransferase RlmN n=2 Tax=Coraliomargaritaceae TaxID=3056371 RepID=A0ABU1ASP9_9BACT|nr:MULTISPECIES: 23S rRNA (adenine(2503)-C(2))-methyltransferase RlmN [unclassified Coraliomargarita]MDQ8206642.1 23S rRNA (adenine(2503)-C(2))-methyltransferase RlmN [Coraliomargarita sp. SDUM461003]WPJ94856.1 23S rRNA (adenine(2503)-C(2))-methyltransferase RlmN [Coraliomargarita sp. J2-16]
MIDSLEGYSYAALEQVLADAGVNPVHAKPLFGAVQRRLVTGDLSAAEGILPPVARWLDSEGAPTLCPTEQTDCTPSSDGFTEKYLLRLADGAEVEAVRMGFPGRFTACLSSQVGCAMGCVFCATGQMGFSRHLTAGEIVAQAHHVERSLRASHGERLRNIVMMGMGEPLHNFEPLMEALGILTDNRGLNIGPARVAISTVGHIPGIQKLARHPKRYSLAVSLHGASDEERGKLIPVNKKWPLADLIEACREYTQIKRARVFFAWTLIGGVNDTADHARRLAELLKGIDAHVNLIPLNATEGYEGQAPAETNVREFQQIIQDSGLPSTVRQRRGIDVAAGCGQLKAKRIKR